MNGDVELSSSELEVEEFILLSTGYETPTAKHSLRGCVLFLCEVSKHLGTYVCIISLLSVDTIIEFL